MKTLKTELLNVKTRTPEQKQTGIVCKIPHKERGGEGMRGEGLRGEGRRGEEKGREGRRGEERGGKGRRREGKGEGTESQAEQAQVSSEKRRS